MPGAIQVPLTLSDRYRLQRELGRGAMGTVYLGRDLKHGREVAVKVLTAETSHALDADRFLAEVKTAAGLHHPNILSVYDSGEDQGTLYYVMPRVEGESLRDVLEREHRLSVAQAVDIAQQVGGAMAYAHGRGVVHRDIKPDNILLDRAGHAYLADFGLARALSSVGSTRRTAVGVAVGSPLYMSPEQAAGNSDVDGRSDVYALGCVLFEMLAGTPPFSGDDVREVLVSHLTAPPPTLRARRADVPVALDAVVQKALAKDPDERHATAGAFQRALQGHAVSLSGSSAPLDSSENDASGAGQGWTLRDLTPPSVRQLRDKRIVQIVLGYLAAGWIVLGVVDQLAGNEVVRNYWYQIALIWYVLGLPVVAVLGWFHGEKGRQRPRRLELILLVALAGVTVASTAVFFERNVGGQQSTDGPADPLDLRRMAVLYLEPRSDDETTRSVADGLTEALIAELSAVPGLDVLSRNAVAPSRTGAISRDSLARVLDVGTMVEGSVERREDKMRVELGLVEGRSGVEFQRAGMEFAVSDLVHAKAEMVEEVARMLRGWLGEEVRLRQTQRQTENVEAWVLYQRGEKARKDAELAVAEHREEDAMAALARADELLAQAEAADPEWVEPIILRAWLDDLRSELAHGRSDVLRWIEAGLEDAGRAVALAPLEPRALEVRGTLTYWLHMQDAEPDPDRHASLFEQARRDLERAVDLHPALAGAHATLSHLYLNTDLPAAMIAGRRAYEEDAYLESADAIIWRVFNASYNLEQFVEGKRWCATGRERFPQNHRFVLCELLLMTTPELQPDVSRAWDLMARLDTLHHADDPYDLIRGEMLVGGVLARAGLADSARAVLDRAHEKVSPQFDPILWLYTLEAYVRTFVGDDDHALDLLERYAAHNPHASFEHNWWWRGLRDHPRWREVRVHH